MERNYENLNPEEMRALILDYLDNKLDGELKEFVTKGIEKNEVFKREYQELKSLQGLIDNSYEFSPDETLSERFEEMLRKEKDELTEEGRVLTPKPISFWPTIMKVAAAVSILVVGYLIGSNFNNSENELAAIRAEMEATKQLVMESLAKESASQRILGVTVSQEMTQTDEDIIKALIKVMNEDPNINVRLTAVKALGNYTDNQMVRQALINALEIEKEPVVQITLINLMVIKQEKQAVEPLKKLINDTETLQAVKDEAQVGLFKLL